MSNAKWLRFYRAVLHLYPQAFRGRHGDSMVELVADRLAEEPRHRVWRDVALELITTVPSQHWKAHPAWTAIALAFPIVLAAVAVPPKLHYLPLASLPSQVAGWEAPRINLIETGTPQGLEAAEVLQRVYRRDGSTAQLLVARWNSFRVTRLRAADKLSEGLVLEELKPYTLATRDGMRISANRFLGTYRGTNLAGYWWRVVGGEHRGSNWRDWLQQNLFSHVGLSVTMPGTAIVRIIIVGQETEAAELEQGAAFVRALAPELRNTL